MNTLGVIIVAEVLFWVFFTKLAFVLHYGILKALAIALPIALWVAWNLSRGIIWLATRGKWPHLFMNGAEVDARHALRETSVKRELASIDKEYENLVKTYGRSED